VGTLSFPGWAMSTIRFVLPVRACHSFLSEYGWPKPLLMCMIRTLFFLPLSQYVWTMDIHNPPERSFIL
jgi:hypothetical protein